MLFVTINPIHILILESKPHPVYREKKNRRSVHERTVQWGERRGDPLLGFFQAAQYSWRGRRVAGDHDGTTHALTRTMSPHKPKADLGKGKENSSLLSRIFFIKKVVAFYYQLDSSRNFPFDTLKEEEKEVEMLVSR